MVVVKSCLPSLPVINIIPGGDDYASKIEKKFFEKILLKFDFSF
jgi:hypothetical protein